MGFTSVIPVILKLNIVETSRNTLKHRNILQTQTHQLMMRIPILNLMNQKWILVKRFTDVNLVILNLSGSKVFKHITKVQNTSQILILRIMRGSTMINQMVIGTIHILLLLVFGLFWSNPPTLLAEVSIFPYQHIWRQIFCKPTHLIFFANEYSLISIKQN